MIILKKIIALSIIIAMSSSQSILVNAIDLGSYWVDTIDYGVDTDITDYWVDADTTDLGDLWDIGGIWVSWDVIETDSLITVKTWWKASVWVSTDVVKDIKLESWATLDLQVTSSAQKIILENWSTLKLWTNVDVKSIVSNNAKSVVLGVNSIVWDIQWSLETFLAWTNVTINNINVSAITTKFWVNTTVDKIYLKTDDLNVTVNTDIKKWIIYVYKNFEWWVNSGFKWKMTVYWETAISVNSDLKWRYCSLWKVFMDVNAEISSYEMDGLLWNIDPILKVTIEDESVEFKDVKDISTDYDRKFADYMKEIDDYNDIIKSNNVKLTTATEDDKVNIQSSINDATSEKNAVKQEVNSFIETTFDSLSKYIDENKNNADLFLKVKNIYLYAVQYEDSSFVTNICNNAEVEWSTNSVYERWWKIYFWDNSFARKNILSDISIDKYEKFLSKVSDDKLAKLSAKIDPILEQLASKENISKGNLKNLNMLLDFDDLIQNELLY